MNPPTITCPYCRNPAHLAESAEVYGGRDFGKIWICRPCGAYVGTHRNDPNHRPLGRLANAELRFWKIKAHAAFDPLWKTGGMSRGAAYRLMQEAMGMTAQEAHIGEFDVAECRQLIEALGNMEAVR